MELGILGLIPVAVLLVVALITKKMTSSLMIAIAVGCIMIAMSSDTNPFTILLDGFYIIGMSEDISWLFFMIAFIGIFIGLLGQTGASTCFIKILEKRVHSEKSLYFWSWMLVLLTFIDDTVRTPILGQLAPLYDKEKVPRASLAYFADSTSTSFATLIPISSWALFYQGVFGGFEELEPYGTPLELYLKTMPFLFYSFVGTIVLILFTMNIMPKLGAMKTAYTTAAETGALYTERSIQYNQEIYTPIAQGEDAKPTSLNDSFKIMTFFAGIGVLVISMFLTGDIIISLIYADIVLIAFAVITRISTWGNLMDGAYQGLASMMPMFAMIFGAYLFKHVIIEMGLTDYVIEVAEPLMSPALLPVITFLICSFLAFFLGDSWGVPAICAAIAIPLCVAIGGNPFLIMGATISGATFGAHSCFYADYTIFTSQFTKIDNVEHAITQLPYGLIGGGITGVLFLIAGFIFV